jgi:thiol-disulfide isomerase/thioredoxin
MCQPFAPMRIALTAVAALAAAAALSACGSSPRPARFTAAQIASALRSSPPPLAALHAQADRLLSASPRAVKARIAALHGYALVINKWASWCYPCRSEFPSFQRAAVELGRRVAFLGLDSGDTRGGASAFLRRYPVAYPSYEDPNERVAYALNASGFYPMTLFYAPSGKLTYVHAGAYPSFAALVADIRRYA